MSFHRLNISFLKCYLILLLLNICAASYGFKCPDQSQWRHRAKMKCSFSESYACVYDQNGRNFTEFCTKNAVTENKGYKVIIRGAIDGEPCDRNFYQPFKFNSSGASRCAYKKSVCTEEGQVIYRKERNTTTDSLCRCDYTRSYDFIHRPQHQCYCVPSKEDCSCYFKICSSTEYLTQDYKCLNTNAWEKNLKCLPVIMDSNVETTTVILTFRQARQGDRDKWRPLMFTLICIFGVLILACLVFVKKYRTNFEMKQLQYSQDGINQNQTTHDIPEEAFDGLIKKWNKRLDHFEVTNAARKVLNEVETHGFVIISGPPESGKSAIAYHAAFLLEKNHAFKIFPVETLLEIRRYILPNTKQVFLIDDVVGKYTVDESRIQQWKNEETFIKQTITSCSYKKVIFTCRSYIYNTGFCSKLNALPRHCDLLTRELKLNLDERKLICHRYNLPELTDRILMMYDFLPLLCSSFSKQEKTTSIFKNPYKLLNEEMIKTKEKSDIAYLAIAFLVLKDNSIQSKILNLQNTEITELLKDLCIECGFKYHPLSPVLLQALCDLIGTYVRETKDGFACIHDDLFKNLSFLVGSHVIHCLLKYGSSRFLVNRLQLASIQQEHGELVIMVKPEQEEIYFQRLLLDIKKKNHRVVFTGKQMEFSQFRSKLLTFLDSLKAEDLMSDQNDSTPLHVVSENGYDDFVFKLYQIRKDHINLQDKIKRTPLFMACLGCHHKVIQTLLLLDNSSLHVANIEDLTPFDVASIKDDVFTMKILLKYDAKLNRKDKTTKRTALQRACGNGSYNAVTFLLTKNADVKHKDINGLKAIDIALSKGHVKIVEILLKYE